MTPYERVHGIRYDQSIVPFAELIHAHEPYVAEQANHKGRAYKGWWLGRSELSGEHIVALAESGAIMIFRKV
eukprot:5334901-Amphidinium_carterae.3